MDEFDPNDDKYVCVGLLDIYGFEVFKKIQENTINELENFDDINSLYKEFEKLGIKILESISNFNIDFNADLNLGSIFFNLIDS